ncbi:MAG: chorismate--pyruvate lyase, partial [Betaproteobacteria bacterium]|nr:chorismate--pyruvate lyase [Betaproteobacteria bacterium]
MNFNDRSWQPLPVCGDARLRRWLLDRGSLTRRIQHCCDEFRLDVISQHMAVIKPDERAAVGLNAGAQCLEREVSLNCDGTPVVFAHSVVAARALNGAWRLLARLGSRPLGAALFADPRIERHPLRFRQLNARHRLHERACR